MKIYNNVLVKRISAFIALILIIYLSFLQFETEKDQQQIFFWLEKEVLSNTAPFQRSAKKEISEFLKHSYRFKSADIIYKEYISNQSSLLSNDLICKMIQVSTWDLDKEFLEFFLDKKNEFICASDIDYFLKSSKASYDHLYSLSTEQALNLILLDEGNSKYSPYNYPLIMFLVVKNRPYFNDKQIDEIIAYNEMLMVCGKSCPAQFSAAALVRIIVGDKLPQKELLENYDSLVGNITNENYLVNEEKMVLLGFISALLYHSGEESKSVKLIELVINKLQRFRGTNEYVIYVSKLSASFFALYLPSELKEL